MKRCTMLVLLFLGMSHVLSAQSTFHVFPTFADGRFGDGAGYRSTLMIIPAVETESPDCSLALFGMAAQFAENTNSVSSLTLNIPSGGFSVSQTTGLQSFQNGYATLTCTRSVFANALYAQYTIIANAPIKIAEATVYSSREGVKFKMIADHREVARLGIAIANNTSVDQSYAVTFLSGSTTRSATVTVPAKRSLAKFLDEMVAVPLGSVGLVTISSTNNTNFSVIGLRFTPIAGFTTVPAN